MHVCVHEGSVASAFTKQTKPQDDRGDVNVAQAELQVVLGQLAALDDDLDMIQEQLDHQMVAQDQNKDDAR